MGSVSIRQDIFQNIAEELSTFLNEYHAAVMAFYAFAIITVLIVMIINITKLAKAGDNPQERSEAMKGILISGICLGILGGIGFIYALLVALLL